MESYIGKICPYCQAPIKPQSAVLICPSDGMPHHRECWEANGGCTTFGCTARQGEPPSRQAETADLEDEPDYFADESDRTPISLHFHELRVQHAASLSGMDNRLLAWAKRNGRCLPFLVGVFGAVIGIPGGSLGLLIGLAAGLLFGFLLGSNAIYLVILACYGIVGLLFGALISPAGAATLCAIMLVLGLVAIARYKMDVGGLESIFSPGRAFTLPEPYEEGHDRADSMRLQDHLTGEIWFISWSMLERAIQEGWASPGDLVDFSKGAGDWKRLGETRLWARRWRGRRRGRR